MDLKEWFDKAVNGPALNLLNELANKFKDEQGNISWRNAVKIFTQFCSGTLGGTDRQTVDKIIADLGLTGKYDTLKNSWQKIPEELRDTTKVLQETPDAITWTILGEDGKSIGTGDIAGPASTVLSFNAGSARDKVDLVLSLKAMDGTTAQQAIDITCGNDQRILEMGLNGTLSVSAGASLNSGFFNVAGKIDTAGTAASLDYYYLDQGNWLFAEALFHNVPHLVSPFDAKAITAAKPNRLEAVKVNVTGALDASLDIGITAAYGPGFTVHGSKLGLNTGDTNVSANMQASLGFTSELNLKGDWTLRANPKDDHILSLSIDNDQSKRTNNKILLKASAGVEGLETVGSALIAKYLPSARSLIDQLEKFENPGGLLKAEINKQVDQLLNTGSDKTLQDNLSKLLVGDETAASLADVLGTAAESALNGRLDLLQNDAENAAEKVLTDTAEKLKLPQNLSNDLVSKANAEMSKLLDGLKSTLEDQVKKIIDNNKGKLTTVFKPLEAVGHSVNELCKDADNLAQKLLGPVIDFLNKYMKTRSKISDFVANSANYSVSLSLSRELSTEKDSVTVLAFDIDTHEPNALERYKEMMTGQFHNALADARKSPGGSGGITLTGGTFKKILQKKLTTDVNFNIFGFDIDAGTILSSDVALQVDAATGDILVAASRGIMDKHLTAFGEAQTVTFVNLMGIPGSIAKGDAGGVLDDRESATITLLNGTGLVLTYSDKSLKRSELEAYIGSAQVAGLISNGSTDAVLKRYDELAPAAQKNGKAMQAYITLSMPLTSADIAVLIAKDDKVIHQTAMENQLNLCFKDDNDRKRFDQYLARWFKGNAPAALEGKIDKVVETNAVAAGVTSADSTDPLLGKGDPDAAIMNRYIKIARSIGLNAVNLVKIVQYVRDSAQMTITEENLTEARDKIEKFNEDTNTYLKSWLKTSDLLSNLGLKSETIPGVTRAFVATIGELCQPAGEAAKYFLVPTVSWSALPDTGTTPENF